MRNLFNIVAICVLSLLAGCASHPKLVGGPNDPTPSTLVVESFRDVAPVIIDWPADVNELNYRVDFTAGEHQKIKVSDGDPVFARVFKLPMWSGPYSIGVATLVQGQADDRSIYYPRLIFLDEAFQVVRTSKQSDFRMRGALDASGSLSSTFFVNEHNASERYVAMIEEPRKSVEEQLALFKTPGGDSMVLPWQIKIFHAIWMVSLARDEPPQRLRASSSGLVNLNFARYKPRKVGE